MTVGYGWAATEGMVPCLYRVSFPDGRPWRCALWKHSDGSHYLTPDKEKPMADSIPMSHDDIDRRFTYHPPTDAKVAKHEQTRADFVALAHMLAEELPDGLEKIAALHKLQEAMFWANAAIACNP